SKKPSQPAGFFVCAKENQLEMFPSLRTVIPEPPHRHSRVGLSGIHLDLGLQQPETPAQHGFPLRACGNDEGGAEV
ncbi:hypothetical protein ACTXPD_10925, partial [Vreelandella alkaliphila]|uniref:hypothetical protein n=1 Tax=Vreelandella alkaliphila TaxID=272774 RepID=UPI003FD87F92